MSRPLAMNAITSNATHASSATAQFAIGTPTFLDADLSALHEQRGALEAWREAFSRWGEKAPNRVSGPFSVAVTCADGRRFLAVDRFAIRTLCYRQEGTELHCAERADALAGPDSELDGQAIFNYFYFHIIPSPGTIFKDVLRLPAGHFARLEAGRLHVAPYWEPEFDEPRRASFPALRDEFLSLMEASVRNQLDSRAIGCYLSGGTDSSTVAGMLTRVTGQPAKAFSIGFDAQGYDEMEYARLAARHFGVNHKEYYITPDDLVRSIPSVAGFYDQPFGNSSALPGFYCAQFAKSEGVEHLLAGDGGDELFGGNTRYVRQKVLGWYGLFPQSLRSGVLEPMAPALKGIPLASKVGSYIEQSKIPMPMRMHSYNLLTRLGVENVFSAKMLAMVDPEGPRHHQQQVWNAMRASTLVNRMLAYDWRYTLAENDLPKVCGTAALAGVAVGFPLLDQRIVDLSLRLPENYKVKGFKLRWFFKEALRGFLPDEILTKKKHGFGLPFGVWATKHPALKRLAEDSVRSLADRGVVRHEFLDELLGTHLPAFPGYYGEMVWIMMMLEQWLQKHAPAFR